MFTRIITDSGKEIITVTAFEKHFGFPPLKKRWIEKPRKYTLRDCDIVRTFLYHRVDYLISPDLNEFKVSSRASNLGTKMN